MSNTSIKTAPEVWDSDLIRASFPALSRVIKGKKLVYLDCAATSLRPNPVIDAGCDFCRMHDGNPHRGMHALSYEATEVYESSRDDVSRWLDAPSIKSVVITRNATSAINLVAGGLRNKVKKGDNIVVTMMEHHANLIPWQQLCKLTGAELRHIPLTKTGELDISDLSRYIDKNTKVVAVAHVSNVLGTINPIKKISDAAYDAGAYMLVDSAQAVGHMPVSFKKLGVDFLVFSAHKCYGPSGLGFLIAKEEALYALDPTEYGGDMIEYVSFEDSTWADIPHRFEAGTANAQAVASFPETIRFIENIGTDKIRAHEKMIVTYALEKLGVIDGIKILGPLDPAVRGGLVAFTDSLVPPHDMSTVLDMEGVAVRAGHHCAQPLHRLLGIPSSTRASFGVYSTKNDVDELVKAIEIARGFFGRRSQYGT
ncbi:MAG: SufS family cysteine desulfurase [Deltaproteobacteria bacterium]|nr:SufS family cysteine desulfurase [Deltaproteobacteria bacterium]